MKIVHTFGCSWTHGCKGSEVGEMNWVKQLAKKYPNVSFRNHALCGASLEFSIAQLHEVIKNDPTSIKIFQITSPFRFTVWDQDELGFCKINFKNVNQYSSKSIEKTERYHGGWNTNRIREDKKFWKAYITRQNHYAEKGKFLGLCDYANRVCDFTFFHQRYGGITDLDIPCVKDEIGEEQFDKYCWDEGFHFGPEGCQWVADWIDNKVNIQ